MKTYLQNEKLGADDVLAFNQENLTYIRITKYSDSFDSDIKKYEYLSDFIWSLNYYLKEGWEVCNREVYNRISVKYGEFHNEINKEL